MPVFESRSVCSSIRTSFCDLSEIRGCALATEYICSGALGYMNYSWFRGIRRDDYFWNYTHVINFSS